MKGIAKIYVSVFVLAGMFTLYGVTYAADVNIKLGTISDAFRVKDPSDVSLMAVLGSGNVGIGTTSPGVPLHVQGAAMFGGTFSNPGGNIKGVAIGFNTTSNHGTIDSAIWGNSSEDLALQTISTGNVGIGTTSPGARLDVKDTSALDADLVFKAEGNHTTHNLVLTGTGNVGIGTTSPSFKTHIVSETGSSLSVLSVERNFTGTEGGVIGLAKSRGTNSAPTIVQDGDVIGGIMAYPYDGNSYESSGNIRFEIDGTPGDGDLPTRIKFLTAADGGIIPTERMRIDNAGSVSIGTTVASGNLHIYNFDGASVMLSNSFSPTGSRMRQIGTDFDITNFETGGDITFNTENFIRMTIDSAGKVGIGRTSATNALEVNGDASKSVSGGWLANSDKRIKTDIQDISNALEKIMKLQPVKFKYSAEYKKGRPSVEDRYYYNFVAQDYQKVFPDDVKSSGEYLEDDHDPILQLDTHSSTIVAIKAIQELKAENDALKQEVNIVKAENVQLKENLLVLVRRQDTLESIVFARTSIENGKLSKLDYTD